MAESVDALVSNTSRFTPVPVRPRLWVRRRGLVSSLFFLCGFVRVGCGVVQRVATRQTYLRVNKCAGLLRNDENILKSSAQTSLADALNLSSKPSVFLPIHFLFGLLSPAAAVQPPARSVDASSKQVRE